MVRKKQTWLSIIMLVCVSLVGSKGLCQELMATPENYHLYEAINQENTQWDWTDPFAYPDYFYINNKPPIIAVFPFYDANLGVITEYADYEPEDGWLLLYKDFGTQVKPVKMPYFVLYNYNNGIMRIFVYTVTNSSYSYLSLQTSFETNGSANLNFVDSVAHALDIPSSYKSKKCIGHSTGADGHWVYSDIPIAYDPYIGNMEHIDFIFDLKGILLNNITLDGTMMLQQIPQAVISQNGGSILNTIEAFGKKVGASYDSWDKWTSRGEKYFKKIADKYKNKDNQAYQKFMDIAEKAKQAPFGIFGLALGIADFFLGGGKAKEPTPLVFEGEIHLSGQMTTEEIIGKLKMRLPGSKKPQYDYWKPVYDMPLGIFNLVQSPIMHRLEYTQLRLASNNVIHGRPWHSYKLVSNIDYTINPNANVRLLEIKGAIVYTVEESLINNHTDFLLLLDWMKKEFIFLEGVKESEYKGEKRTYFTFRTPLMSLGELRNKYVNVPFTADDERIYYINKVWIKLFARFQPRDNPQAEPTVLVTKYQPRFDDLDSIRKGPWGFLLKAKVSSNTVTLSWPHLFNDVVYSTTLTIEESLDNVNWKTIKSVTEPNPHYRQYTHSLGTSGQYLFYRLRLGDKYNMSVYSDVVKIKNPLNMPLSVSISGPTVLNRNQTGNFTAYPKNGSGIYTNYKWWRRDNNDDGPGPKRIQSGTNASIRRPPPGEWTSLSAYDGKRTASTSGPIDFSVKCEVTDSNGKKAYDIHSVRILDSSARDLL